MATALTSLPRFPSLIVGDWGAAGAMAIWIGVSRWLFAKDGRLRPAQITTMSPMCALAIALLIGWACEGEGGQT